MSPGCCEANFLSFDEKPLLSKPVFFPEACESMIVRRCDGTNYWPQHMGKSQNSRIKTDPKNIYTIYSILYIYIDSISTPSNSSKKPKPLSLSRSPARGQFGSDGFWPGLLTPTDHWARPADETSKTGTFLSITYWKWGLSRFVYQVGECRRYIPWSTDCQWCGWCSNSKG